MFLKRSRTIGKEAFTSSAEQGIRSPDRWHRPAPSEKPGSLAGLGVGGHPCVLGPGHSVHVMVLPEPPAGRTAFSANLKVTRFWKLEWHLLFERVLGWLFWESKASSATQIISSHSVWRGRCLHAQRYLRTALLRWRDPHGELPCQTEG